MSAESQSKAPIVISILSLVVVVVVALWNVYTWSEEQSFRAVEATRDAQVEGTQIALSKLANRPVPNIKSKSGSITAVRAAELSKLRAIGTMISADLKFTIENVGAVDDTLTIRPSLYPAQLQSITEESLGVPLRTTGGSLGVPLPTVLGEGSMQIVGFGTNTESRDQESISIPSIASTDIYVSLVLCQIYQTSETPLLGIFTGLSAEARQSPTILELPRFLANYDTLTVSINLDFLAADDKTLSVDLDLGSIDLHREMIEAPTGPSFSDVCQ